MRTSAYWKSQVLSNWNTDVHYFVCRFAEDARNKCNAEWDNCVDNYVYVRQIFDAFTFRGPIIALDSGRDGYFGRGCNAYL
uniref:Uncharacterized protein n=2 Tax=Panagrolaimus TaxID=55784 RepID=A0A914PSX9_9BILA